MYRNKNYLIIYIYIMIDYEKVDKLVENCKNLYHDIPDYCLWVLACDYYINESRDDDDDEERGKQEKLKKDALEAFNKAQEEFTKTKYENIKVVQFFFLIIFIYTL